MSFPQYPYPAPIIPAGIALTVGDTLRFIAVANAVFPLRATVNIIATDGSAASLPLNLTTTNDRLNATASRVPVQFRATIVSASMELLSGSSPIGPGNCYVALYIERGGSTIIDQVFGGYYYYGHNPSYPAGLVSGASGLLDSPKGRVYNILTPSTTPLAAAGVSFGPPANTFWKVSAFRIKLITSGGAGSRLILVYMTDGTAAPTSGVQGTNAIEEWVNNGTFGTGRTVVASTTEIYKATGYQTVDASATINKIIQTPFFMPPSFKLFIQDTAAIDAVNDKVTINTTVEEWITG